MRRDHLAEHLLSLVASRERAASAVGDLLEEVAARGGFWFWRSVLRVMLSLLVRDLAFAPLAMVASSTIAWFLYMLVSLVLAFAGYIVVTLAWGGAYLATHHTGVELVTDLLRVRVEWQPISGLALYGIQAIVLFAAAPFVIGRGCAPCWRSHELSFTVVMLLMWTMLAMFVPLVGIGIRASPAMVPVMVLFVLAGALSGRSRPVAAS